MHAVEVNQHPGLNLTQHSDVHVPKNATVIFGFWIFLMSDMVFFGLMFAIYITMIGATADGPGPKELFDFTSLALQTGALLLSSLTAGMALLVLKYNQRQRTMVLWLLATLILGLTFLTLEVRDFIAMFAMDAGPWRSGYLSAFFGLVPLHGLHVTMGCLWLVVLLIQLSIFGMVPKLKTRFMRFALFWHFLDLIWIGIFSIVYFGAWTYG
ncbi:cytochrome o ubiquinol oxidase subunit III [Ruegeria sp. ANG-R]|uniref:cytochrome c oxidase subunit 3 n=1 Tax=Ruegeria sp. ANG-R TaxID=1577903 RepID=UPI0005808397|nr:cytochrome c oxidase subunit 3 [Ruegeria sp. ANG-R]KIC40193.1 cytochrome o ubiquinol oxidase subunit III [Ruegeria sp. ANG-R]